LSDQDTFTAGPTTCLAPSVPLEPVSRMLAMSFGCAPKKVRPRTPWKLRRGIFTACSHLQRMRIAKLIEVDRRNG